MHQSSVGLSTLTDLRRGYGGRNLIMRDCDLFPSKAATESHYQQVARGITTYSQRLYEKLRALPSRSFTTGVSVLSSAHYCFSQRVYPHSYNENRCNLKNEQCCSKAGKWSSAVLMVTTWRGGNEAPV